MLWVSAQAAMSWQMCGEKLSGTTTGGEGEGALLVGWIVVWVELEAGGEVVGGKVAVVGFGCGGDQSAVGADHLVAQADPWPERPVGVGGRISRTWTYVASSQT